MEKLNLDGLSEWTPCNAAITKELLLTYHDAFALEPDELGCTSAIKNKIPSATMNHSKSILDIYLTFIRRGLHIPKRYVGGWHHST